MVPRRVIDLEDSPEQSNFSEDEVELLGYGKTSTIFVFENL